MKRSEKVRRTLMHLIREFGFDRVPDAIREFEDKGIYDEDYADDIRIAYNTMKKRRSPRTKYTKFHMNQSRIEVEQ